MSTGPKQGWGGYRPGAGRPKRAVGSITIEQIQHLLDALTDAEAKYGQSLPSFVLDLAYQEKLTPSALVSVLKEFNARTMAPLAAGSDADQSVSRRADAGLPPLKPDPAKVVPIKADDE